MTAATHSAPSRESFFSIYWDHARDLPRQSLGVLARFESAEVLDLVCHPWDELLEYQRVRLRAAIMQLLEIHDAGRAELARIRELQGETVPA